MVHHSACLLLLTCLAGFSASETGQSGTVGESSSGPSSVEIYGVNVVTVGIPYGFQCSASCNPGCLYTWTRGNDTSQGPELSLELQHIMPPQILTCTAVNPVTGISVKVSKTLQVTVGPSNLQINGPSMLTFGTTSIFTCSADCSPSCTYSWTVVLNSEPFSTTQGNTISVTPPTSTVSSETLICQAQNTVSQLFISTKLHLWVASLSDAVITGDSRVTIGKQYSYICSATCIPSCEFTWKFMGRIYRGDQIELPIMHQDDEPTFANKLEITFSDYSKIEPLTCEAINIASRATITTTMNLTVTDPISVHPTSQILPMSGRSFSLECAGSQNPESVMWLKNKDPMPASERVHFSPDNITMTFSPLLQTDDGLYQCEVAEGRTLIQSVGYKMQVNYGPSSVQISGVEIVTVGILYGFQCSANCYPTCQFIWIWGNETSQGQDLSLQLEELQPAQNLTCTAINPATGVSVTVQKTLEITAGPSNISISGEAFLVPGVASNFTCSANCYPSCTYSWTIDLDGEPFSTAQGNTISVIPPSTAITETLICQVQDTVSHLYISKSLVLWVANGPSSVQISGVDIVSVGILYGFQCSANCYPTCQFTWTWGNVTSQGQDLSLQPEELQPAQNLLCTAVNPITGVSITVQKALEITAGPSNISISGEAFLVPGVASNFTCSADCYPSCNYSWTIILDGEPFSTAQGNTISVIPPSTAITETLICQAKNNISNLYISRTLTLFVANGPSSVQISGVDIVSVGILYSFQCSANCYPTCQFTWTWGNVTSQGQGLSLKLEELQPAQNLTCTAINPATGVSVTVQKTLEITAGPSNISISGQALLIPGIASNFTCSADCYPSCTYSWTVDLYGNPFSTAQGNTISVIPPSTAITETLICQATNTISNLYISRTLTLRVANGPSSVVISGVDIMTVGILYGFQCSANCYPTCQFIWTWGNETSQGQDLSLQLEELQPAQNLTCTAINPATGVSVTVQKTLEITAGPSNIHISGQAFLTPGVASNFTCSAHCSPSCSYSWTVDLDDEPFSTAQGNTISVIPPSTAITETLICQAQDTVSHLYISKSLVLWVASLSDAVITGDSRITVGKQYSYICSATCIPSCDFTWKFMGRIYQGDQIQLPIMHQGNEPLTCEVMNTLSNTTITATMNLTIIDPFEVHPSSQELPVAGEPFSLQCVGHQDTASITWLKNKHPMAASERVHFSPDNTTVKFSPLLREDRGLYQCLVLEGGNSSTLVLHERGTPIWSVGYLLQVNYGPDKVLIVKPKKGPVGEEIFVLPASVTELQCLTDCFPACSVSWFYHGTLLSTNATIFFTPETPPNEAALTCVAFNSMTKKNQTAETTVVVPDGPKNVIISGLDSLEIGITASFTCTAECTPSCNFTWILYGKTITSDEIDITVNRHISKESISCQAENPITGKMVMVNRTLSVSDPHWCGC